MDYIKTDLVKGTKTEIIENLNTLKEGWGQYRSELFEQGKLEAAEIFEGLVNTAFAKLIEQSSSTTNENKKAAEILADNLRQMRIKTKRETYQENLLAYLSSKLEDYNIPQSVFMEIAQYTYTQTCIVADDEVYKAARIWRNQITKSNVPRRRSE